MIRLEGEHLLPYSPEIIFGALTNRDTWENAVETQANNGLSVTIEDEVLHASSELTFQITKARLHLPMTAAVTELVEAERIAIAHESTWKQVSLEFDINAAHAGLTKVIYAAKARFRGPLGLAATNVANGIIHAVRKPDGSHALLDAITDACQNQERRTLTDISQRRGQLRRLSSRQRSL